MRKKYEVVIIAAIPGNTEEGPQIGDTLQVYEGLGHFTLVNPGQYPRKEDGIPFTIPKECAHIKKEVAQEGGDNE